jgi:Phage phiEco32-like COOH.NH2 ligase-type 2
MKMMDLVNKKHYPIRLLNDLHCSYYGIGLKKGTELVIIDSVYYQTQKKLVPRFFDPSRPGNAVVMWVKPELEVEKIRKDKKSSLYKAYKKYFFQNLGAAFNTKELYIGSDPEIFAEDEDGQLIPAFNFLGSKTKPTVANATNGQGPNNMYWDGFQAEFETAASHCMGWHGDSLQNGLKGLHNALKVYNPKAKLSVKTVFDIPQKVLAEAKAEHVAFGCNKSLNVYGAEGFTAPGHEVPYRSAGGHIHIGFQGAKFTTKEIEDAVKAMDAVLGVAAVSMFGNYDDKRRRLMYGLAGEYRLPKHGLEYRTLSNAWLFHPVTANIVFDLARSAFKFGQSGLFKYWKATEQETQDCINTCDVKKARAIIKRNEVLFRTILGIRYGGLTHDHGKTDFVFKMIMQGAKKFMATPYDIAKNWDLNGTWDTHCDGKNRNVEKSMESIEKGCKI